MATDPHALLEPYRRKRDFTRTPEPSGARDAATGADGAEAGLRRFVVQRHRARRLHYDFRLEINGVLASWAVPKGPTLDPDVRRLAVHVEDHPMEYELFEGIIPRGEYGGGDVIVWDRGTWRPHGTDDPAESVRKGELHLDLFGDRLRGRFALVRTGGRGGSNGSAEKEQWLLVHKHDDHAVAGWDAEELTTSVISGRTNDEVKAAPDRLWRSDLPASEASVAVGDDLAAGPRTRSTRRSWPPTARGRAPGAGLCPDHVGRARRPRAARGPLHDQVDPRPPRDAWRPVSRCAGAGPAAPDPALTIERAVRDVSRTALSIGGGVANCSFDRVS